MNERGGLPRFFCKRNNKQKDKKTRSHHAPPKLGLPFFATLPALVLAAFVSSSAVTVLSPRFEPSTRVPVVLPAVPPRLFALCEIDPDRPPVDLAAVRRHVVVRLLGLFDRTKLDVRDPAAATRLAVDRLVHAHDAAVRSERVLERLGRRRPRNVPDPERRRRRVARSSSVVVGNARRRRCALLDGARRRRDEFYVSSVDRDSGSSEFRNEFGRRELDECESVPKNKKRGSAHASCGRGLKKH